MPCILQVGGVGDEGIEYAYERKKICRKFGLKEDGDNTELAAFFLENAEKYYIDQAETPAHTADWVQKAKRKSMHAADLIDYELQRVYATGQHFGYSDEELNPFMKRLRDTYQYYLMSRWPEQDWPAEHREE